MSDPRTAVTARINEAIRSTLDPIMAKSHFRRTRRNRAFSRKCADGEQRLEVYIEWRPRESPTAICRLFPWIGVIFPEIDTIALDLAGGDTLLIGDPNTTLTQPIDSIIPRQEQLRWYVDGLKYVDSSIESIAVRLIDWVLPFMDEIDSVRALVEAYENRDRRIQWLRTRYVFVVASYLWLGKPTCALKVLQDHFGRPATRKQYARAYECVFQHLSSASASQGTETAGKMTDE